MEDEIAYEQLAEQAQIEPSVSPETAGQPVQQDSQQFCHPSSTGSSAVTVVPRTSGQFLNSDQDDEDDDLSDSELLAVCQAVEMQGFKASAFEDPAPPPAGLCFGASIAIPSVPATFASSSCLKCGLQGHWSRDCPCQCGYRCKWLGQGCQAALGTSVGSGGGSATSGSRSINSTQDSSKGDSGKDCFKCGLTGHWARDCPCQCGYRCKWLGQGCQAAMGLPAGPEDAVSGGFLNRPSPRELFGADSGAAGGGCFKCGKSGHWARDCTEPRSRR